MHTTSLAEEISKKPEITGLARSGFEKTAQRVFSSAAVALALIIAVCILTFARSLTSYFLADDIGEIRYVHQIFEGNWQLFWSNFCGNYMQVPNMSVYRPVLLLTLVFDYALWKANPFGYYLSNLVFFTATSCLLYLFISRLCKSFGKLRANLAGFFSAVLFASNPLHCESISWVVGRVDSACAMFYLASLCIFLYRNQKTEQLSKKHSLILSTAGVCFFALAIGVKEMAIGLAPVLAALAFLGETEKKAASGFQKIESKMHAAWQASKTVWYATAFYFLIRYLSLGTLLGGYNGSVGASQSASAYARWLDPDNWQRLLLPLPYDIFSGQPHAKEMLLAAYFVCFFLVLIKLLCNSVPWRICAFLFFWALSQAAPIYRLFGLGYNLEGARFCFFLSMSLSALLPVVLLAPDAKLPEKLAFRFKVLSMLALSFLALNFNRAAYVCNLAWIHAGKEVKAVWNSARKIQAQLNPHDKVILLGVPKEHKGAHMILNGATFAMLLSPPFTKKQLSEPFFTFDPVLFGDRNLIDGARLRSLINQSLLSSSIKGPYVWDRQKKSFELIPQDHSKENTSLEFKLNESLQRSEITPYTYGRAKYSFANGALTVRDLKDEDGILLTCDQLSPLAYSYLKISFKSSNNKIKLPFLLRWQADANSKAVAENQDSSNSCSYVLNPDFNAGPETLRTALIPIGRQWRWYAQSKISQLGIFLPAVKEITISKLELLAASEVCPQIILSESANNYGVISCKAPLKVELQSKTAESLKLQVSKREFFFENMQDSESADAVGFEIVKKGPATRLELPEKAFNGSGYYQLRAVGLDKSGRKTGDYCDAVSIWVNP